jgi:hypothetical protein
VIWRGLAAFTPIVFLIALVASCSTVSVDCKVIPDCEAAAWNGTWARLFWLMLGYAATIFAAFLIERLWMRGKKDR